MEQVSSPDAIIVAEPTTTELISHNIIETVGEPLNYTPLGEAIMPKVFSDALADIEKRRELNRLAREALDDNLESSDTIQILKPVVYEDGENREHEASEEIQETMNHLSQTTSPEVGTERVQILQDIVDKMTDGLDVNARVVIMNRGENPAAFVFPDGTIFISQSLINKLGSLDEIAAVMAHEINHLRFKTFENKQKTTGYLSGVHGFGIGWTHELASDTSTPELLVKAGFNSGALATAMKRIGADNSRGSVHQSSTTRSTQVKFVHLAEDFATSDQTYTPMPESLVRDFGLTNEELLDQFSGIYDKLDNPVGFLSKLCKRDFEKSYQDHFESKSYKEKSYRAGLTAFYELVGQRLEELGYDQIDIDLFKTFLYGKQMENAKKLFLPSFGSAQDVITVVQRARTFSENQFNRMHMALFDTEGGVVAGQFLNHIEGRIVASEHNNSQAAGALRFTDTEFEQLIDTLVDEINKPKESARMSFWDGHENNIPILIYSYAKSRFAGSFRQFRHFNETDVRNFFQHYADKGISYPSSSARTDEFQRRRIKTRLDSALTYNGKTVEQANARDIERFEDIFVDVFYKHESIENQTMDVDELRNKLRGLGQDLTIHAKLSTLISHMYMDGIPDTISRDELAQLFLDELGNREYACEYNFLKKLPEGVYKGEELSQADQEKMSRLYKLHVQLSSLLLVYKDERTPAFFEKAQGIFETNRADIESLNLYELLNLFHGLGISSVKFFSESTPGVVGQASVSQNEIKPTQELLDLLPMQLIHERANEITINSVDDLHAAMQTFSTELLFEHPNLQGKSEFKLFAEGRLYSNDIFTVIAGDKVRRQFNVLLAGDLSDQELQGLKAYLSSYYPEGPRRDLYISKIDNRILRSATLTLNEKILFLQGNFDSCGVEGLTILADQIETLDEFRMFKTEMKPHMEAYLGANNRTAQIATADVVSALFADKSESLFESASEKPETKERITSRRAADWLGHTIFKERFDFGTRYTYNAETNTIRPDSGLGLRASSFADLITKAKSLGRGQRLSIALKALTESGGALHDEESRKQFGNFLIDALKLPDGFVQTAVRAAIDNVEPDTLSLPAAQLAAPLLFRALDVSALDISGLHKAPHFGNDVVYGESEQYKHRGLPYRMRMAVDNRLSKRNRVSEVIPTQEHLRELLSSETHDILDTSIETNSPLGQVFNSVRGQYIESLELFDKLLVDGSSTDQEQAESGIDTATEAVIRGIESSGPIGVRSLQLATQLQDFSPEVNRRLAHSLDSNAGLNKLLFWHNLDKFAQTDPEVAQFVQDRLIRVGQYLGGGSLNTTYEAFIRTDDGEERRVVLKMLSPNAKSVIGETYGAATTTLRAIERETPQFADQARTALMLVELANQWCLTDIDDPHFHEDDAQYQQSIAMLDTSEEGIELSIPEIALHTYRLKSEDIATGTTVNKLLNDPEVSPEVKQRIARTLGRLFVHELTVPTLDEAGNEVFILRSDPHTGNQVVDVSDPAQIRMGIIDRHMYLKMAREDMNVARAFVHGDAREGVTLLLDRIMVHNKVTDDGAKNTILMQLVKGRLRQRVSGKQDELQLIQILSKECAKRNLDIPLPMRLLLKNIESVRQLTSEYGVDLSQLLDKASS